MKSVPLISFSILFLLCIGLVDWITGFELSISIFYLIPIALCAWFISWRVGLMLALMSTTVWFFSDLIGSPSYSHPIISYWNTLVMLGIFVVFAWLLSVLKGVVERENIMALSIQKSLLPQKYPEILGFRIYAIWQPTRVVSGDYYDFINLTNNNLGVSLADVCGHGFPAALLMSNIQATLRIIAGHNHSPKEICDHLNSIMINYMMPEKFTSFFYGVLNAENKEFTYSNAGHPPPIIIRNNGEIYHLSNGGLLLGVDPNASYQQVTVQLEKGDVLLLYTDGILETRNAFGEEFGESRLIDICKKNTHLSENDFGKNILTTINKFSNDDIDDDITLVIMFVD
jgi:phosphoserine phosphatase RsbU/P